MPADNFSIEKDKQEKIPDSVIESPNQGNKIEQTSGSETRENAIEKGVNFGAEKVIKENNNGNEGAPGGIVATSQQRKQKQERIKSIEKVLEKDLDDIYLSMPADKRQIFRAEGEKTSEKINELMEKGKATIKKVVFLIRAWLLFIPGVNKFFLEQETKIKADEIMNIK